MVVVARGRAVGEFLLRLIVSLVTSCEGTRATLVGLEGVIVVVAASDGGPLKSIEGAGLPLVLANNDSGRLLLHGGWACYVGSKHSVSPFQ